MVTGPPESGCRRRRSSIAWLLPIALTVLLLIPPTLSAQPPVQPVRLLLVYGIAPELPEVAGFTKQLRLAMRNEVARPVEFYQEYLDLDRFPGRVPALADYFDEKYRGYRIDIIVAIGNTEIGSVKEFDTVVAKVDKSKPVPVLLRRGELATYLLIRPAR